MRWVTLLDFKLQKILLSKFQKLEKAVLDEINRDVGNADVDYYIAGLCLHSPF